MTGPSKPAVAVDEPAGQDADGVDGGHDQRASTLGVVLAQTAGSSDLDGVADAVELGGRDVDAANGLDLTTGVVLVDELAAWPGQLIGAFGGVSTVGTISTNANCGGPAAGWQRVATGFLLGYTGASRAAYAADLRDYLTWWADTATPDHPADSDDSGDRGARPPGASSSTGSRSRDGHGGDPLAARRADVDAYAGALREAGASPATISRRLATLRVLRLRRRRPAHRPLPHHPRPPTHRRRARRVHRPVPRRAHRPGRRRPDRRPPLPRRRPTARA